MGTASHNARWYTLGGLVLTGVLLLAANAVADRLLSGLRLDLTDNRLYTLSQGTRAVLADIEEPVNLYFFYSEEAAQGIPRIASHARRVRELLEEFSAVAGGKLRLNIIDPAPFSDEEDRAVALGVEAVPLSDAGRNLYFGLAGTSAVGEREVISYFQLNRATLLEYDLAKLVYQLAHPSKPVVGLLSGLPMEGGFEQRTMQRLEPWMIYQRVNELFDVRALEPDAGEIPQDVQVLLLVHPHDLDETALYAVDQYVLRGGKLLAFVDPYAEAAANPAQQRSSLDRLFQAWGIEFDAGKVIGDAGQAIAVSVDRNQPPVYHLALIGIAGTNINDDDVITRGLTGINLGYAGALSAAADAGIEFTPLLSSSPDTALLDAARMVGLRDPGSLQQDFAPGGEPLVVAARVAGTFTSAFPEGRPGGGDGDTGESGTAHRAEATDATNIVLVADTDLLSDRFWVQFQSLLGQRLAIPFANNADFVVNALDNLLGSNALINIRSRADYVRPFDRVQALRRAADAKFRQKEQELQTKLLDTERKLSELQSQQQPGQELFLSPEQQQALASYQEEQLRIRKQLRDVRHQLDKDIEALGTTLKFINILLVPVLLSLGVAALGLWRTRRGGAEAAT